MSKILIIEDEVAIAEIRHWSDVFTEMEKRKATVLENIEQAGALTGKLLRTSI